MKYFKFKLPNGMTVEAEGKNEQEARKTIVSLFRVKDKDLVLIGEK